MNVLVLYFSKGGNTRKLAQAILEGVDRVKGITGVLKNTEEVTKEDFLNAGGVIAGSPVYFGTMAAELKSILDKFISTRQKMEGKVGAAFTTSADMSGGKETTMMSIIQAFLIYGMIISGDPFSATGHYGTSCVGAPDEKTIENGKLHGERVARLVLKLKS